MIVLGLVEGGSPPMSERGARIIEKARELGATMAGLAAVEALANSPSHQLLRDVGTEIDGVSLDHSVDWPKETKSAVIFAVSHPYDEPELDWWDADNSSGNRILLRINRELASWIEDELGIKTHALNYSVIRCGVYLKDAAVLAGLGCIGRNNLLVTPELGPRVRLRGMLMEEEFAPTGPIDFDPCDGCEEPCREACPQAAFTDTVLSPAELGMDSLPGRDGHFGRARCMVQMEADVSNSPIAIGDLRLDGSYTEDGPLGKDLIKYCRRCEFACPVGG
jgi:epoxyqueuosine reductase